MEYQIEDISEVKKAIKVHVPAEEVNAALGATLALYRKDAAIDGFRKGKVPSSIIESKFKKQIYSEATTDLVNVHINEIMGEKNFKTVSRIEFDGEEFVKDEPYDYKLEFEVMPSITIPEYEGMEVKQEEPEVDEAEVEEVFTRVRNNLAEFKEIDEDRSPKDGEIAVISFAAFNDEGKSLENLGAENFELPLGESGSLPEFEDAVKRLKPKEQTEEPITFPEDFLNPDLAGKTVTMRISLVGIKEKVLPELNDELAKKAGGFETVDAMREAVKNSYIQSRMQLYRSAAQKRLLDDLLAKVDFPLPEAMVDAHQERMVNELKGKMEERGKSLESLGKSREDLKEQYKEQAEELARSEVFLLSVAHDEGLEVNDQEMDQYFQQLAVRTGEDFNTLRNFHVENNLIYAVRDKLLADKAMEHIYSKAKVVEVPAGSLDEKEQEAAEEA